MPQTLFKLEIHETTLLTVQAIKLVTPEVWTWVRNSHLDIPIEILIQRGELQSAYSRPFTLWSEIAEKFQSPESLASGSRHIDIMTAKASWAPAAINEDIGSLLAWGVGKEIATKARSWVAANLRASDTWACYNTVYTYEHPFREDIP